MNILIPMRSSLQPHFCNGIAWYTCATGCAAALAPWLIRVTLHLPRAAGYNLAQLRFAFVFFLAGLISGFVYWLLAGRDAGASLLWWLAALECSAHRLSWFIPPTAVEARRSGQNTASLTREQCGGPG